MVNKQYRSHINFPFSRIERECYSTKVIKKKWGQTVGQTGIANSTRILFIAFSSLNHVLGTRFVTGDYASFGSKFFLFVNNELFLLYTDTCGNGYL